MYQIKLESGKCILPKRYQVKSGYSTNSRDIQGNRLFCFFTKLISICGKDSKIFPNTEIYSSRFVMKLKFAYFSQVGYSLLHSFALC